MSLLFIDDKKVLGLGHERACFIHPTDETKCIKVSQKGIVHRNQNQIESYYFGILKRRSVPFTHLAEYYGEVHTDWGDGLVFERILDFDGQPSQRFDQAITSGVINQQQAINLLDNLKNYLLSHAVYIGDCNPDQLLLQRTKNGYCLKVIDGLGTRNFGLKLRLLSHILWYARYKIRAKWPTIQKNYRL